ncbi:aminoglycoside phosphotransferase family protein [Actinoplanes sp. LDG1-06]|uniref:Aminoglycoside phosphotransferase family protein n=1 Tax=Paractinoplanes ovalisporus TaxID=2810368 RepID=A0ABS2AVA2_9ACTN|nr:phosphotransferase [Actinoplanes ovalisporus]MBM2623780.1 aminoglycoside phosphotransferase family protein [Actinoplanes ovalisporus]
MRPDFTSEAMRALRVRPRAIAGRLESRSGAGVHPVTTADGAPAFLKVAPGTRELRFYQELSTAVPVRTPDLLGHVESPDGVALLLEAAGEPLDVTQWTPALWAALFRDLAALHAMAPPAGWATPDDPPPAAPEMVRAFWEPALPQLDELLSGTDRLIEARSATPPAFIHGDCHTANITHLDGTLVFCDWQQAGVGRPAADLALLSVRATPAGVTVPIDAGPSVVAEELALLLFQWPFYAAWNTPDGNARIQARARTLADEWLRSPGTPPAARPG